MLISCSDWTEIESLEMIQPDIKNQNPELYAEYLKGVREFKNSDHKVSKTILKSCKYIILPLVKADNKLKLDYEMNMALVENVPNDRFIMGAASTSLELSDQKTGYWADGTRALQNTAHWILAPHSGNEISGIALYNVSNDYFNPDKVYKYTRIAINTINPSPKK